MNEKKEKNKKLNTVKKCNGILQIFLNRSLQLAYQGIESEFCVAHIQHIHLIHVALTIACKQNAFKPTHG